MVAGTGPSLLKKMYLYNNKIIIIIHYINDHLDRLDHVDRLDRLDNLIKMIKMIT